jgi:hypothetical protein
MAEAPSITGPVHNVLAALERLPGVTVQRVIVQSFVPQFRPASP